MLDDQMLATRKPPTASGTDAVGFRGLALGFLGLALGRLVVKAGNCQCRNRGPTLGFLIFDVDEGPDLRSGQHYAP